MAHWVNYEVDFWPWFFKNKNQKNNPTKKTTKKIKNKSV